MRYVPITHSLCIYLACAMYYLNICEIWLNFGFKIVNYWLRPVLDKLGGWVANAIKYFFANKCLKLVAIRQQMSEAGGLVKPPKIFR